MPSAASCVDQLAKLPVHLREPRDHLEEAALLANGNGRRAEHVLTVRNASMDAGLCPDDHAVADLGIVLDPGLTGDHDVIARLAASGDADLAAEKVVAADLVVVADHDEVIDLRPFADPRGLEGRAIDRAVRPDLHVILDFEPTCVRNLHVAAVDLAITEAITAENAAGVHFDPISARSTSA